MPCSTAPTAHSQLTMLRCLCARTSVCACVYACVRVCVRACVRACLWVRVPVCVRARVRVCVQISATIAEDPADLLLPQCY